MFGEDKSRRFYVGLEHLLTFEQIINENNIDIKTEIDPLTNNKTQVYYIRERDFLNLDKVCSEKGVAIIEDNTLYYNEHFWINKLPKWLQVIVIILILLLTIHILGLL